MVLVVCVTLRLAMECHRCTRALCVRHLHSLHNGILHS